MCTQRVEQHTRSAAYQPGMRRWYMRAPERLPRKRQRTENRTPCSFEPNGFYVRLCVCVPCPQELARFYLLSHNLTAKGSLFRHLKPSDMSGLFSITRNWWRQPDQPREGYDLIILYGT